MFVEQLSAFLEYCNSITGCLLILGDFNFHLDHPTDQHMSKILDLLKIFNLAQSVNLPTHTHGHILDWIIYRPDDNILVPSSVSNELTSDHFALLCSLDLRIPDLPSIKSSFRNIKCIDRHQLASEINLKIATIVNPTADTFHHCLRELLDKHSSFSSKLLQVRKCSPL